jgi:hypothetical protein
LNCKLGSFPMIYLGIPVKMNGYLFLKWIWKIVQKEKSLWCELLYAKYMDIKDLFFVKS